LIEFRHVAFVEYDDELQAGIAMSGINYIWITLIFIALQGTKLTEDYALQISYAKK